MKMCFYLPDNDAQEFINMAYRVCISSPVRIAVGIFGAKSSRNFRERALATSFEQSIGRYTRSETLA